VLFAVTCSQRAWVLLRRGDLSAAELDARAALETPALPAPPIYQALACGVLVASLQEQGYMLHADAAIAPFTTLAEAETQTSAVLRFARGRLRVEQGKLREGLEDLLAVGRIAAHTLTPSPGVLPWRSAAAAAHLALGERGEAERLAAEEVALARALGAPRALGIALRTAGTVGEGKEAAALLEEAVVVHEQADAAIELVRSRLEHGALLRRTNRRSEARDVLRAALDGAHRTGAKPLATRAEAELRATGAKPRRVVLSGVDSLTASERRIATLAAEGLTNREIAQTLYVTARTVEGHLTSVFRKLDVDSRDHLPALLAGSGAGQAAA
jgi:DNA-binding CsgD family transcriptional regulator